MRGRSSVLLVLLALVTFVWSRDPEVGTNALAHVDQTVAIVESGTLAIEGLLALPHAATTDWAARGGHLYSAKAPGLGLAGVPVDAVLSLIERMRGEDPLAYGPFERNGRVLAFVLATIPGALGALVFARLASALGASPSGAALGALAIALGTTYAPYASSLYAHVPSTALIALAGLLVLSGETTPGRAAGAGFAVGLAVWIAYASAVAIPVLLVALALRARQVRPVAFFLLGGLPLALALGLFHRIELGSFLATEYDFQNPAFSGGRRDGYFAALGFRPWVVIELTLLPYRGVFVYAPVVAVALAAAGVDLARGERDRRIAAGAALALFLLVLLTTAAHPFWWGGFAAGPRLLIPGLALLAPFAARALERWPHPTLVLGTVSVANALACSAVALTIREDVGSPLVDAVWPSIVMGRTGRASLGQDLGLSLWGSLALELALAGGLAAALAISLRRDSRS
jgi:hypothetical protein